MVIEEPQQRSESGGVMGYCQQTCRSTSKPSWLQAALSDLEQRLESLSVPDDDESDSFGARAENYYQKRPQLISLLHDLHGCYLSLADRYSQALTKPQSNHCCSLSQISFDDATTVDITDPYYPSDTDSSLSFQPPLPEFADTSSTDAIVVEVVIGLVDREILSHEIAMLEKHRGESNRKMELQRSLVEVLESERIVLLSENARLGAAAAGEREVMAAEVAFLRRKAGELASCVVRLREGHRVCALGRQIETLQSQIYGLEKRNRECYEVMARREEEKAEVLRGVCHELERVKAENRQLKEEAAANRKGGTLARRTWGWHVLRTVACGTHAGKAAGED